MRTKLFFIPLIALFIAGCDNKNDVEIKEDTPLVLRANLQKKVAQDNEFAFQLLAETVKDSDEANVFISPLSMSIALGMAWNGADNETKREMERVLNMADMSSDEINEYYQIMQSTLPKVDSKTKLNIANSIWYRTGFPIHPKFLEINKAVFDAEVRDLDFSDPEALKTINAWCAQKTNNLIKEPLDKISVDAMLYLINAIYFKGIWATKFDKKKTSVKNFTNEKNEQVKVNMMHVKENFAYTQDETAKYLDMPYGNGSFSMTVILPHEDKTTDDVLQNFNASNWDATLASLQTREVDVQFPRFKISNNFTMNDVLEKMGMQQAFSANQADFSKISDLQLFISRVIHSTFCEVNEEGTEAAAVTIIEFENTSISPGQTSVFHANRPFIFLIREKNTGAILFTAKIGDLKKH